MECFKFVDWVQFVVVYFVQYVFLGLGEEFVIDFKVLFQFIFVVQYLDFFVIVNVNVLKGVEVSFVIDQKDILDFIKFGVGFWNSSCK